MDRIFQIAVDGPGGAGKSTVAKAVAKELNIEYIDTGAMYRALGLKMLRLGMEMKDGPKLRKLLDETSIDFRDGDIILDGEIVSRLIRTQEVSMAASGCSAFPIVREKMVDVQQKMGESKSVIMDGRDICEVVFPNARYKYFITAEPEERAKRRYKELIDKGQKISYEEVLTQIRQRDLNDSSRSASPMKKAPDAELLDTTHMTVEEAVKHICDQVLKNGENLPPKS